MGRDPEEDFLLEKVRFGIEVEAFFNSQIGRYLESRIMQEEDRAKEEMVAVDPDNIKAVRDIQNKYKVANSVSCWLAEVINAGYQAETQLKETEV